MLSFFVYPLHWAAVAVVLGILWSISPILLYPSYDTHENGLIMITGTSTGIGRAAVVHLAKKYPKYTVLAGVRKDSDAKSIQDEGLPNLEPLSIEVTNSESIQAAFRAVKEKKQPLIAVVNNAGIQEPTPIECLEMNNLRRVFDVNVFGLHEVSATFLPLLRESKGRLIQISSWMGEHTLPGLGAYAATKHAVEALTDALRIESQPSGVAVISIQPGAIESDIKVKSSAKFEPVKAHPSAKYHNWFWKGLANEISANVERPVTFTNEAIDHAITSSRPRQIYRVYSAFEWVGHVLLSYLPHRLIGLAARLQLGI